MVKAAVHGATSICHAFTKKLPRPIVSIVCDVGDWLGPGVNRLGEIDTRVRRIWEFPVEKAAFRIG